MTPHTSSFSLAEIRNDCWLLHKHVHAFPGKVLPQQRCFVVDLGANYLTKVQPHGTSGSHRAPVSTVNKYVILRWLLFHLIPANGQDLSCPFTGIIFHLDTVPTKEGFFYFHPKPTNNNIKPKQTNNSSQNPTSSISNLSMELVVGSLI